MSESTTKVPVSCCAAPAAGKAASSARTGMDRKRVRRGGRRSGMAPPPGFRQNSTRALLVPQRVDGIERRGLARRVEAEEDPDGGGEAEGEEDRPRAHLGGQARE